MADFWGGHRLIFKVIEYSKYLQHRDNIEELRRNAIRIGPKGNLKVDISGFEYCRGKQQREFDHFRIYTYTPEMVIAEKLRALCQQMKEYGPIIRRNRPGAPRARDFFDIHQLMERYEIDLTLPENQSLLKEAFQAKRVPMSFLLLIPKYREFHRHNFISVQNTLKTGVNIKEFDFYFDFIVDLVKRLEIAGNE